MPPREVYDITVKLIHETERAVLVNDGTKQAWLPKAAIEYEKQRDGTYILTGPVNLLKEKGFI